MTDASLVAIARSALLGNPHMSTEQLIDAIHAVVPEVSRPEIAAALEQARRSD